ncbi:hypothetical protein [Paracoccus spongiarum]|uniref:Uncharacterized protein n=1 Tax=Paracoccus spongiarum TaxID=3064387 RepID=A0ABT9JFL3_9RHOB|nr:hypothetical protein [Paracoccus sp. 2205BS29-5]MDP5307877.1 hypothetical protein [Paracoccus sp. 2205BS29-5]
MIDVETCDNFFLKAIGADAQPLGWPSPLESHLGRSADGIPFFAQSEKAVWLFDRTPTVARAAAARYPVIGLKECQDASVPSTRR